MPSLKHETTGGTYAAPPTVIPRLDGQNERIEAPDPPTTNLPSTTTLPPSANAKPFGPPAIKSSKPSAWVALTNEALNEAASLWSNVGQQNAHFRTAVSQCLSLGCRQSTIARHIRQVAYAEPIVVDDKLYTRILRAVKYAKSKVSSDPQEPKELDDSPTYAVATALYNQSAGGGSKLMGKEFAASESNAKDSEAAVTNTLLPP